MTFLSVSINFYKYKRKLKYLRAFSTTVKSKELKLLFFGTDSFSLPSLQVLHQHTRNIDNLGIVTSFKSPSNCVRLYAEQHKLHLLKWPVVDDDCNGYDLGVVVSFGHLIPTNVIRRFPLGMLNVHASLLPRWRGAAPIIYAIMNGDKETGVSIMRIEPKRFDIGDIFAKKSVPIKPDVYMPELHKELAQQGANLLLDVLKGYPQSFENPMKQNEEEATFAPKITSDITDVDWGKTTAEELYKRHRALYTYKVLSCTFQNKVIELLDVRLPPPSLKSPFPSETPTGLVVYSKNRKSLQIKCANNTFLEVFLLRVVGRKAVNAADFNNGFLKKLPKKEMKFDNKTANCI